MVNANFLCDNLEVEAAIEISSRSTSRSDLSENDFGGDALGVDIGDTIIAFAIYKEF